MKFLSIVAALFLAEITCFGIEVSGLNPPHEGVIKQGQELGLEKSFHRTAAVLEMKHGQRGGLMKDDVAMNNVVGGPEVKDDVAMNNVVGGPEVKDEDETTDDKGEIYAGQGEVKAKHEERAGLVMKATKRNIHSFDDSEIAKILSKLKINPISSNPDVTEKHQNEGRTLQDAVEFEQIGSDIDGEAAADSSGFSLSMSSDGNRVAIGAYGNDAHGSNSGHVRIYERTSSTSDWTQIGSDIDGEAVDDVFGSSVSMSSDGNRVAIGAPDNGGNGSNSGRVRIYEWDENILTWTQIGSDIDGEAVGDHSGSSVSISGDGSRVAIGAYGNDAHGSNSGHVRIYEWTSSTSDWTQIGSDIDGEAVGDSSGFSLSISSDGNRVAIGAPGNGGNGILSGHVRIYERTSSTSDWTQIGSDIDGEAADDSSGSSVSMSSDGNRVAIGAPGNGSNSGHVRIYEWNDSTGILTWTQIGSDIDGEAVGDHSGSSVSISGDGSRVAIGAYGNDAHGSNSGHVRIFEWNVSTSDWTQIGSDIDGEAAADESGFSVSISGDGSRVAIGAPGNDAHGSNSGHVRIYDVPPPPTPSPSPGPTPSPTPPPTPSPSPEPTPSPTPPPTTPPTPGPTPSPTPPPTPSPTVPPTTPPTPAPTPSPTVSPFSWEIDSSGNWTATFDENSAGNQLEGKYKMTVGRNYKFEVLKPDCKTQIGGDNAIYVASNSSKIVPYTGLVDAKIGIAMAKLSAIDDTEVFSEGAETNTDKIKICIKGSLSVSDTDPTSVNFHETILTILINKARTFIIDIETERTAASTETENVTVGYNVTPFICADGDLKNASTWVNVVSNYGQGDPLKVCLEVPNTEGVYLDKVTKFELEQVTGGSEGTSLMIGVGDAVMAGGILADSECSENACMIQSMIPAKYFDDIRGSDGTPYNLKAEGEIVLKLGARRLKSVLADSSSFGRSDGTSRGLQSGESTTPSSSFEVSVGLKGENMVQDDGREVSAANPSFAGRLPVLFSFAGAVLFTGVALVN